MARKPPGHEWDGFTVEQARLLDQLDFYGNNGWSRTSQSELLMPGLMADMAEAGMSVRQVQDAMESIGYSRRAVHELERWERKRTTGKFGR
ncbi:hypothetical protein ACWEOD_04005 [Micrococcus luteus]|uniref:hypothetical protein n=1 Tax=Micrococcus luteus TaxID=1270 RepID=UPI00301A1F5C|nr:hypothetical protein [Micrococcus luteus]